MPIALLSNETINKIAAGEVVERPLNVVKELVENSIDSGATAISIEIKGGGSELIRVTDNGCGINANECEKAFLRHATSKITSIEDLDTLNSLGFRGEALSSISAVSKTEMITKTSDALLGIRTVIEGGKLLEKSEVGAPDGTTIIVRDLFYNTPARKKFLKSANSEGALIEDIVEKFALSNQNISFTLLLNGKTKIHTSGNNDLKDVIFRVFGKEVYNALLPVNFEAFGIRIYGYVAKPEFSYQARNGELYFVNGRFVRSKVINTAIEEVYRKYLMQHRFPFCVLEITVSADTIDVNVHPQKLEVKFSDNELLQDTIIDALNDAFNDKELIPETTVDIKPANTEVPSIHESIDTARKSDENKSTDIPVTSFFSMDSVDSDKTEDSKKNNTHAESSFSDNKKDESFVKTPEPFESKRKEEFVFEAPPEFNQESFFDKKLLSDESLKEFRIIGQVFDTYWLMELDDELYIVDQHAAHEKVNYENLLKYYNLGGSDFSQQINPPYIINLSATEASILDRYSDVFTKLGFEIEDFGINSFAIRAVPMNLFGIEIDELFSRLLDELIVKDRVFQPTFIVEKIASLSCKAAIKGGQRISMDEMSNLMKQLMTLDNPYNCPHGRPVFVKITKKEMEKKFKRIL